VEPRHPSLVTRSLTSAILLAAGRGKRQRPYTDVTPKPLLEVNGRATLDYVLCAVKRAGIKRVCIVTHHLEEQIFDFVGDGSKWNLSATFCHQEFMRGSGDAVLSVLTSCPDWIDRSAPVLVSATDYLFDENALADLVAAHSTDITVSLKECPPEEISARSSVAIDSQGRVTRVVEKPAQGQAPSRFVAALVYILPPALWDVLPKVPPSSRGEIELPSAVNMLIEQGFMAKGFLQPTPQEWQPEKENE
jgi:NDP-sugar pyrophosphorylase family protein